MMRKRMIDDYEIVELRILEILESESRWWTIEEIAASLDLSKATIQKYLGILKSRLEGFSSDQISIDTSTSKGVFLHRAPSFNIHFIYSKILKELLSFTIFDSFLYNEYVSIVKISSENFVSIASIRRKYRVFNTYFKELNLSIKKDKFTGDERQIRWFFSELYWQIFRGTVWPFQLIPEQFVRTMLNRIENFFNMELIPEAKEEMMYWITVNGIRHIKGHRVLEDDEIKKYALNNPLYPSFIGVLSDIFPNEAKNKDAKGAGEMQYLFLLLSALPILEKNEELSQLIHQAHKKGKTLMYQMTQDWIELYEVMFGKIYKDEDRYNIENKLLRIHSFSYLYTMGENMFFKKSYVQEIIEYHPRFFQKMELILESLNEKYEKISENRAYLMEHYALLATEELAINQFERSVRLSLNFSKGTIYESVVRDKLLAYFSGKYKLDFVNYTEPKEILITDLPHILKGEKCSVVSAHSQLTLRDYENIEQTILKYI